MSANGYKIVYKGGEGEIVEKKSRFIAYVKPVDSEEEASAFIEEIKKNSALENKLLPLDVDYETITGLRLEARQKLNAVKPMNLGQASRISGVSPADINTLIIWLALKGSDKQ